MRTSSQIKKMRSQLLHRGGSGLPMWQLQHPFQDPQNILGEDPAFKCISGVPKVAKFKGGYSSNTNHVYQLCLKDIWFYILECHLSQWAIQLVKDYTLEHGQLEVEYYFGLTPESEHSFQGLIDHFSLIFQSCKTVSSLIADFYKWSQKA